MKGGPRQMMRNEQYLRRAETELLAERKEQEERERKAIDAARFDAAGRGVVATTVLSTRPSCLDVGPDFGSRVAIGTSQTVSRRTRSYHGRR